MYVRDAKNRDEVRLLDNIEAMGLDDIAFRSRDYVLAVDERTDERAGFGRVRVHKTDDGEFCELTSLGVLEEWRGQGVGAHIVERLVEKAGDDGFSTLYAFAPEPGYLAQFGFDPVDADDLPSKLVDRLAAKRESVDPDAVPMRLTSDEFEMPSHLRDAFKRANPRVDADETDAEPEETAEDFGIDPDSATYKYDTGR